MNRALAQKVRAFVALGSRFEPANHAKIAHNTGSHANPFESFILDRFLSTLARFEATSPVKQTIALLTALLARTRN